MENTIQKMIAFVNAALWGVPLPALILGVGLYLSIKLRFVQLRRFPEAFRLFLRRLRPGKGGASYRAFCAALAATVGTGNLVGVAGAICLGGPGAVFWMWICGLLGMVIKYAEAALAVRYRVKTPRGFAGGPMHIIRLALPKRLHFLAWLYACFGFLAAFGVGNVTQIHAALGGIREAAVLFGYTPGRLFDCLTAAVFAAVIGAVLLGGAAGIYRAAEQLVPLGAAAYLLLCLGVLVFRLDALPHALGQIFLGAFSPGAVTGGLIGSAFRALRFGCSRGLFTNEAGMGTAAIAHAGAEDVEPAQQGFLGIMEVFLDTLVMCTLTALVILVSGVSVPYGTDGGGQLTGRAFASVYGPGAAVFLGAVLSLFAVATVIGWGLYGARCGEFLFGNKVWRIFPWLSAGAVILGTLLETPGVWLLAEVFNGLMAIPNLIMLAVLTPQVCRLTIEYKDRIHHPAEVPYADFHQRKPLRTFSHEKVPPSGCGSQERGQENLSLKHRPA